MQLLNTVKSKDPNQCEITAILTFHSPTNFHFYCPLAIIIHPLQIRVLSVHFNFHCISVSFNIGTLVVQGSSVPVMQVFYHVQWGKHFHLVFNLMGHPANQYFCTFTPSVL